jgi:hypothetical protein
MSILKFYRRRRKREREREGEREGGREREREIKDLAQEMAGLRESHKML